MGIVSRLLVWLLLGAGFIAVPLAGLATRVQSDAVVERVRLEIASALGRPVYASQGGTVVWGVEILVALHGVSVPRPAGRADPTLVTARSIEIAIEALPLLWGETRLRRITVLGPRLIADGELKSLAGWEPHQAHLATPEIVVVDGAAEITARFGGKSFRLVFDHLSGRKPEQGPLQLRASGVTESGQSFSFEGTLTATADGQRFDAQRLLVGGSTLTGDIMIEPRCDRPRLTANLRSSHLMLDDWADFVPWPDQPTLADAFAGDADAPTLPFLDGLTAIDLALDIKADRADWAGHAFADARVALTLANGRLSISNLRARAGDGSFALSAVIDRYEAAHRLVLNADQLALAEFGAGAGIGRRQTRLNIDMALSSEGKSWRALLESLSGNVRMVLANADMRPPDAELFDAVMPWVRRAGVLNIDRLFADLSIESGRISTNEITVETPRVAMVVDGMVDFSERSLHVELTPTAKDPSIADLSVPLMVTGPLDDPAVLPNPLNPSAVAAQPNPTGDRAGVDDGGAAVEDRPSTEDPPAAE